MTADISPFLLLIFVFFNVLKKRHQWILQQRIFNIVSISVCPSLADTFVRSENTKVNLHFIEENEEKTPPLYNSSCNKLTENNRV